MTPITVRMMSGTHNLELQKDGFAVAKTPLDVNPDEAPGGSITITLGGLADDTIELRDGSILKGDVISVTLESVVINVQGKGQSFNRNQVKKIFLVERIVTHSSPPSGSEIQFTDRLPTSPPVDQNGLTEPVVCGNSIAYGQEIGARRKGVTFGFRSPWLRSRFHESLPDRIQPPPWLDSTTKSNKEEHVRFVADQARISRSRI